MPENTDKLGHLSAPELTEFLIPVLCTGTKLVRISANTYAEAAKEASDKIETDNRYSEHALRDFKAVPLPPELMLAPEDRAGWPYWGYGWYGTDGIDWRSYRTDKGIGSIPGIAEESWPIPPYGDDGTASSHAPWLDAAETEFEALPARRDPFVKNGFTVIGPGHGQYLAFRGNMRRYDIRTYGRPVREDVDPSLIEGIVLDGHAVGHPEDFWSQHCRNGTADTFRSIARLIPATDAALRNGIDIKDLVRDEWLGRCAGIYFDLDRPDALVLIKGPGFYWFQSNGRHRVLAARRAGMDAIPAVIIGEITEKPGKGLPG